MQKQTHALVHSPGRTLTSVTAHTHLPGYTKLGPRTHLHILQLFSPLTKKKERVKTGEIRRGGGADTKKHEGKKTKKTKQKTNNEIYITEDLEESKTVHK